ncbi:MAG: GIY-YIG nuclease family protein [Pseudomonadota bacterium]
MKREHRYFVYILASKRSGTLYIGVTNDLYRRTLEHKASEGASFTARYGVNQLVWFEEYQDIERAIAREKAMKKWKRRWKIGLIEENNPYWEDLFKGFE